MSGFSAAYWLDNERLFENSHLPYQPFRYKSFSEQRLELDRLAEASVIRRNLPERASRV